MFGRGDRRALQGLGAVLAVPAILAGGPVIGYFIGSWIDRRWPIAPWGTTAGVAVGMLVSCLEVYRIVQWIASEQKKNGKG